jgi:hypothetical protein
MTVRRFGPVLGAGVQVSEEDAQQEIVQAPWGVSVLVSEFEKGPPMEPQFLAGRLDFDKRNGGLIENGDGPQSGRDFYKMGRGAGELITLRVTGGNEKKAILDLWTRQGVTVGANSGRRLFGQLEAKSGGRWAGRRDVHVDDHAGVGDLTATSLDTGDVMVENEWRGGTLQLKKVTTKVYRIVGNTAAGIVSVEADQDLLADFATGIGTPVNRYVLSRDNADYLERDQQLAAEFVLGEEDSTAEFGIVLYEDAAEVKRWKNLSADPTQKNYWVNVVNRDLGNYWVVATDSYVGDKTVAAVRPANYYGLSKTLAATKLTLPDPDVTVSSPVAGANPAVAINSLGALVRSQVVTGTVENGGADIRWTTTIGPVQVVAAGFTGVPTELGEELLNVTVTNGGTALIDGDTIVLNVLVLEPNEAVGGTVWPDVVNEPGLAFTISANDRVSVDVRTGLDLTDGGAIAAGEVFQIVYRQEFGGGADSRAVTDADYLEAFDPNLSPLNKIFGKNKGYVKVVTPGLVSTVVSKAGIEYAAARNYQFKLEFPDTVVDEAGAIAYVNVTIGRSEYAVCHFPSFGYVLDPDVEPSADDVPLKLVSMIGMILGREALVARQNEGYHKAPAGTDVTLPDVLELPTGDPETATELNEELTNPQGVNLVKFRQGVAIMWGDRTLSPTSAWKFHHQRALMSHYENVLRENFDWIVFAINNSKAVERAKTTLRAYFHPEWVKGALRGTTFEEALKLKIDAENNTDADAAAGDLNAELKLKLAETVERFKIVMGKQGIFDAVE